jgi:hypothetical protein
MMSLLVYMIPSPFLYDHVLINASFNLTIKTCIDNYLAVLQYNECSIDFCTSVPPRGKATLSCKFSITLIDQRDESLKYKSGQVQKWISLLRDASLQHSLPQHLTNLFLFLLCKRFQQVVISL